MEIHHGQFESQKQKAPVRTCIQATHPSSKTHCISSVRGPTVTELVNTCATVEKKTRIHNYTCSILHHVCSQIQISSQRIYFNMKTPYHQKEYQFIHIHQLSVPAKVIYLCLWDVSAILANSWGDSMHCIFCSPLWSAGSTSMKSYNTFCVCYFSWHGHNHGASKQALSCVRNVP